MDEIRVKIDGGHLVASKNPDSDYDGISVYYERIDGTIVDIVIVEAKEENKRENIDVYCYKNIWTDDFSEKFVLNTKEITKMFKEINS